MIIPILAFATATGALYSEQDKGVLLASEDGIQRLTASLHATAGESFGANDGAPATTKRKTKKQAEQELVDTFLLLDKGIVPDDLLLAVLLSGTVKGDPIEASRTLIRRTNGRLERMFGLEGANEAGISPIGRARLLAATELMRRVMARQAALSHPIVDSPKKVYDVLKGLSFGPEEVVSVLFMDRRMRLISARAISVGSSDYTIVDPRVIFRIALEFDASGVILCHQHPSGDAMPSTQDLEITRRVAGVGRQLGIPLLDHLVIGGESYVSLAERGELPTWTS